MGRTDRTTTLGRKTTTGRTTTIAGTTTIGRTAATVPATPTVRLKPTVGPNTIERTMAQAPLPTAAESTATVPFAR